MAHPISWDVFPSLACDDPIHVPSHELLAIQF